MAGERCDYLDLPLLPAAGPKIYPAGSRGRACGCYATIVVTPADAAAGKQWVGCRQCNGGLRVSYTALGTGIAQFYAGNYAQALLRYAEARAAGELSFDDADFNIAEVLAAMVAAGRCSALDANTRYRQLSPSGKHGVLISEAAAAAAGVAASTAVAGGVRASPAGPTPVGGAYVWDDGERCSDTADSSGAEIPTHSFLASGSGDSASSSRPGTAVARVAGDSGVSGGSDEWAAQPQPGSGSLGGTPHAYDGALAVGTGAISGGLDERSRRIRYLRKKLREAEVLAGRAELARAVESVTAAAVEGGSGLSVEEEAKLARRPALAAELVELESAASAAGLAGFEE
jgi:hypothetical protein